MNICKVLRFDGRVRGGPGGIHDHVPRGECGEVRGAVEEVTLKLPWRMFLKVNGNVWRMFYSGPCSFPRIDVGEEVILHIDHNNIIRAIQVLKNDKAVFRFLLPEAKFGDGSPMFIFEDMEKPEQND